MKESDYFFQRKTAFDNFQLEEYKNISTSHYESVKQISTFFRYYLLLLSAPALILSFIDSDLNKFLEGGLREEYYNITFMYFLLIAFAGFCLFVFTLNVRHDSILYAKTVNKVRRYFYENSQLKIDEYENYISLPISATKPNYLDKTIFLPLILVFAIINSAFLYTAFYFRKLFSEYIFDFTLLGEIKITNVITYLFIVFFLLHFITWFWLSNRRENKYLKSYRIGVDIDGVLNKQTEHFVEWLKKMTGKEIESNDIKEIPVHLNEKLGVTEFDEWLVFNCKEYWETLPCKENSFNRLIKFRKTFGYKVRFYSFRPWPIYGSHKKEIEAKIISKGYTPLKENEISDVTKSWLKKKGIKVSLIDNRFNAILNFLNPLKINPILTIEKGNPYITDYRFFFVLKKQLLLMNRFQGSKSKKIKFFFEDTPENAIKLSNICDYVFLFDEPYNKGENTSKYKFPKNIIRVKSWDEVYSWFKILS